MNHASQPWPPFWRLAIIALGVLILCSCKAAAPTSPADLSRIKSDGYATLPPSAMTGAPEMATPAAPVGPPGMELGVPMPYTPSGPWSPPGISQPWPKDEYLRDGGHLGSPLVTGRQGEIRGMEMEDTAAQFQTADGRKVIEPSNAVYLYSPRFGAVRQVVNLQDQIQVERSAGVHEPLKLVAPSTTQLVGAAQQNLQTRNDIAAQPAGIFLGKQNAGVTSAAIGPRGFQDAFKAYENFTVIRQGIITESETAWLMRASDAAANWTTKQAVQVVLGGRAAMMEIGRRKLQETYTIDEPGNPRLRLIKVASTPFAEPGDKVDFTLRFDNVGNQVLSKVAIVDNLSTRLEYIPNSAQCSRSAKFSTAPNQGDSLAVRCELSDPLKPGEGGVLRFHCRVR